MVNGRRSRHSLAVHLLALYLLLVGPILAAAIFFDVQASRQLRADVAAADLGLAQAIALETDDLLRKAGQAVEAFAQMPEVIAADPAGMEAAFGMGAAARPDINLFYRLDARGIMVFHYPVGPRSTVGTDFSFRDYFQSALTSAGPVYSRGRISPTTQRAVATVAMPIHDAQGRFSGVVATNLDLERLAQTLVTIARDPAQGVRITILDAAGQVVACSHPDARPLLAVSDALPGVTAVLAGGQGSLIARAPPGGPPRGPSPGSGRGDGEERLFSYSPIPAAGWGVVVERPTAVAFATSRAFHRGLLLAVVVIALGAALFWWGLSGRVIRPLEQLTRFGLVGGQQTLPASQARSELEALSARPDQIGDLARTLVRMEADLLRRVAELQTLLETSTAIVSSLEIEQVIDSILEQVRRLLGVDICAVLVLDETTSELEIRASRGLSEQYVQQLRLDTASPQLPAWQAIRDGRPVQVADVETDPTMAGLRPLVRAEGLRSLLAVPLVTPHAPAAVLVIYHAVAHHFSPQEIDLAMAFANQAAMALENASLFGRTDEELQRQVRSLKALNQVMLTASQSLVLDDVLHNALDAVLQVMEADAAWIYLVEDGDTSLRLHAHRGLSATLAALAGEAEIGQGLGGWVVQFGQTLLVDDVAGDERLDFPPAVDEGLRSLAAVPLRAKEAIVGALGAATRTDRCFSSAEVELLSAIGSQIGIAVENARLYQRSRRAAVLEERNRLAREIHDALAHGLTGIVVQLEATERLAQRRPDQALASLQRARDLARRSLQEARRSVWGLRPTSLEDLTLAEALEARVAALRDECGLEASFGISGSRRGGGRLAPDVELNLFRIAQEALSNVQRHAQAESVHVQLDYGLAHLRLIIEDDGVGLPERLPDDGDGDGEHQGFGLIGMRERAALLGGDLKVMTQLGHGVRIEVIVPG